MLRDEHLQGRDISLHSLGGDKVDHAQIQIIVSDADRSEYISLFHGRLDLFGFSGTALSVLPLRTYFTSTEARLSEGV